MKPKNNYKPGPQDVMQTPPHALEPLYPYLNKNWFVWESAAGPERLLANELRKQGYSVHDTDLLDGDYFNYFTYEPLMWNVQVTNCPFSIKYDWFARAFELRKPFAILAPYETTFAKNWQKLFEKYNGNPWKVEVLSPERRIDYKTPYKGWDSSAQMPTAWITWGLNVHRTRSDFLRTYYVPMRSVKYDENNELIDRK